MSESKKTAIEELEALRQEYLRKVSLTEMMINDLSEATGQAPRYPNASLDGSGRLGSITPDQFYGRPLATAVTEILERRKLAGLGAATVNEIYDTLIEGGYEFNAKNDENAKRGLYGAMSKNQKFHKLPNGRYGLLAWYPNVKKGSSSGDGGTEGDDASETAPS